MSHKHTFSATELLMLSQAIKRPEGLTIWLLTSRIGISLRDAANAYRSLSDKEFMEEKNDRLFLTSKGRNWVLLHQQAFAFSGKRSWREVPTEFKETPREKWSPYAPRVSKLDKANFRIAAAFKRG